MPAVRLDVPVPGSAYPILIRAGLWQDRDALAPVLGPALGAENLLVTSASVEALYGSALAGVCRDLAPAGRVETLVLPDGERYKTLDTVNDIITRLLELGFSRQCTLIALGGGVVGDMTGFAAAIYQRGVRFVQIPTTLLAQVDSSVGGKTGVNHPLGKNMMGAFKQPRAVLIDTDSLRTLPRSELAAGLAEVLKYGLIQDADFLDWLEASWASLLNCDTQVLQTAIQRSCAIKAAVVAEDETEQGRRAILNFGHTFGHAIETHAGYGGWLHGEAVATGMLMATDLSARLGWVEPALVARVQRLLEQAGLPVRPPQGMALADFLTLMARDKKVAAGQLRLVLLKATGHAIVTSEFPQEHLEQTIANYQN